LIDKELEEPIMSLKLKLVTLTLKMLRKEI